MAPPSQVTVHFVPAPTFVLICQLGVSAAVVKICDMLGYLEADKFEWDKVGDAWNCMEMGSKFELCFLPG